MGFLGIGATRRLVQIDKKATNGGLVFVIGEARCEAQSVYTKISGDYGASHATTGRDFYFLSDTQDQENKGAKEFLYRLDVYAQGPITSYKHFFIDSDRHNSYRFSERAYVQIFGYHGAAGQSAFTWDAGILAGRSANHKGVDVAYCVNRFYAHGRLPAFKGEPAAEAVIEGYPLFDPRDVGHSAGNISTYAYSANPALGLLTYLTESVGAAWDFAGLDLGSFKLAASLCDALVPNNGEQLNLTGDEVPFYNFVTGQWNVVVNGEVLPYQPDTAAAGEQPRMIASLKLDPEDTVKANIEKTLQVMHGHLPFSNGKYKLIIEDEVTSAVMDFDDDSILGNWKVKEAGRKDRLNRATVTFFNKNKHFKEDSVSWPKLDSAEYAAFLAEDSDQALHQTFDVSGVPDYHQASAWAEFKVRNSRSNRLVTVDLAPKAMLLEFGDVIDITSTSRGWTNKWFRVRKVTLKTDGTATVDMVEYDASIYPWSTKGDEPLDALPSDPGPWGGPAAITGLTAQSVHERKVDGSALSGFAVTWDAPTGTIALNNIEVAWKLSSEADYDHITSALPDSTSTRITGLVDDTDYDIRLRYYTNLGQVSADAELLNLHLTDAQSTLWDTIVFPLLKLAATGDAEVRGNSIIRTGTIDGWGLGGAYSVDSSIGSAALSFRVGSDDKAIKMGLTTDPQTLTIDFAWKVGGGWLSDDPYASSVVYVNHFDGVDGATASPDESNSAHATSFQGNVQIDTAQSVFGGASALFDGTTDKVLVSDSDDWNFGAGEFTIECRARYNVVTTDTNFIGQWGSGQASWHFRRANTGAILFGWSTNGSNFIYFGVPWSPSAGVWYTLAVDRDAVGKIRIYIDGVMVDSDTTTDTFFDSSAAMAVGDLEVDGFSLNGWIDEVRITKGVARYADDAGYTIATEPFPRVKDLHDPLYGNVALLLGFEGADGSTTFTDESSTARSLTAVANAQLDTAESKFGGASGLFDGSGDYVSMPDAADLTLGANDFTLETWVRFRVTPTTSQMFASHYKNTTNQRSWFWRFGAGGTMDFAYSTNGQGGGPIASASWTPVLGVWYHVAVCRSGADLRMFVDGAQIGTTYNIGIAAIHNSNDTPLIGSVYSNGFVQVLDGWLDEMRWTIGVARYTADFAVPFEAYPRTEIEALGGADVIESGQSAGLSLPFTTDTEFKIIFDGVNVNYVMDGVVEYTSLNPPAVTDRLFIDSALNEVGASIVDIAFDSGPTNTADWSAINDDDGSLQQLLDDAAQAKADAADALSDIAGIVDDALLTPDEKPRVIQDRDQILAEQPGIDAQATAFGITAEKTAYDNAITALTTYLATLTTAVLWSDLGGDTTIVGATFRQKFLDVYDARQALLDEFTVVAATLADWSNINDDDGNLPEANAQVNAVFPVGYILISTTNVNPATWLGYGTWSNAGAGRVLIGVGTGTDENAVQKTITAGQQSGEYEHTQTLAELVSHSHVFGMEKHGDDSGNVPERGGNSDPSGTCTTNTAGSGNAFNVSQPSLGVYLWERTA